MKLYPLKFTPITHYRIWGGSKLNTAVSKELQMDNLGEIWSISGVEGNLSVVINGELKGKNLKELVEIYQERLVGKKVWEKFGNEFPLLIKFLDADADLSVQVHPNDQQAKELHNSFGKSEMWYIMDAEPNSELTIGFKKGIQKEEYQKHLEANSLDEILNKIPVQKGDAIYIPAGRVHAIGAGVVLAEIQQTSDITYRIYDYNRLDKDGKKRQLHTENAGKVIDFTPIEKTKSNYQNTENKFNTLIETPYFETKIFSGDETQEFSNNELRIYICTEGKGKFTFKDCEIELKKYESLLIPADCLDYQMLPSEHLSVLEVVIP